MPKLKDIAKACKSKNAGPFDVTLDIMFDNVELFERVRATGVINALRITVTAVTDTKTYDGNTISTVLPAIAPALVGGDTSAFTQAFDSANAGPRTLTPSGPPVNDGNGGNNYAPVVIANTAGVINQALLTLTANIATKTYDGATATGVTPTLSGLVAGDTASGTSSRRQSSIFILTQPPPSTGNS